MIVSRRPSPDLALVELGACAAVVVERWLDPGVCQQMATAIREARAAWTSDFEGEQYSLGRAFYTHLETGASARYFAGAAASDALVEATVPKLQPMMLTALQAATGGRVRRRPGFCGPGVIVFPAHGPVSERGGVIHFDTEGLSPGHLARRARTVTLVVMLQPPAEGGGLQLWDVRYDGHDEAGDEELARPSEVVAYGTGDLMIFESYRLHRIMPFSGTTARISATVHAVEVDPDVWEAWF